MQRSAATIWKGPDFLPEMSGILDNRIPPFEILNKTNSAQIEIEIDLRRSLAKVPIFRFS